MTQLRRLEAGQQIVVAGDQVLTVDDALAAAFAPGDALIAVAETRRLLHVPAEQRAIVDRAVSAAVEGFAALAPCTDEQITEFFDRFAQRLDDPGSFASIAKANAVDVEQAASRGRSTTRLVLDDTMRAGMIAGLNGWRDAALGRDDTLARHDHDGWSVEARRAPLGVVGFVFEGRPNVFADACGVVRTGNSVVFRIGSDALGTAQAIVEHALTPALAGAGMPAGTVSLVASPERSAGHALFADRRLSLAVARGSGPAVAELGAVAAQSGIPVSLHGTGGAWIIAGDASDADRLRAAARASLDRKVCNTLNVCAVPAARAAELVPVMLDALDAAAADRGTSPRLHVVEGSEAAVPAGWFDETVEIMRADGVHREPRASVLGRDGLATEWEWEASPEVTLVVTESVGHAVALCNEYSPHFVVSVVSDDAAERDAVYDSVDAPFVGDGFTRWVDGQYALDTPELGLSNWERGRMLGRGAILSGDSVFTVRYRATIDQPDLRR
ncbi:MAG: aldehyde dehydrogenase family protein [Actinomycetota bacterium]